MWLNLFGWTVVAGSTVIFIIGAYWLARVCWQDLRAGKVRRMGEKSWEDGNIVDLDKGERQSMDDDRVDALRRRNAELINQVDQLSTMLGKFLHPGGWTWENPEAKVEYDFDWLKREFATFNATFNAANSAKGKARRMEEATVTISLDIPDPLFLVIAVLAHKNDVTINEMIVSLLKASLDRDRARAAA